ncbi:hypothetical protein Tco_0044338 [Tanacetum coccineum]
MSCLPNDIMESVISCEIAKATWIDLVHSFEGPLDTNENRIIDLKLEYQTFRAKPTESLSQTYTRCKTLLNKLANDGVNLSTHEINVGFVNSLPEKWLTFSYGLRNANHTQTLDLVDIYERFVYEDNLIQRRYSDTKKALITTPSNERSSEEYLRDLDIELHERALLANLKCHFAKDCFSKTSEPSYKSPVEPKIQKDYKAEYKKMKANLALLEASTSTSQNPKTFQPKNKGLVAETFDWDEEEFLDGMSCKHIGITIGEVAVFHLRYTCARATPVNYSLERSDNERGTNHQMREQYRLPGRLNASLPGQGGLRWIQLQDMVLAVRDRERDAHSFTEEWTQRHREGLRTCYSSVNQCSRGRVILALINTYIIEVMLVVEQRVWWGYELVASVSEMRMIWEVAVVHIVSKSVLVGRLSESDLTRVISSLYREAGHILRHDTGLCPSAPVSHRNRRTYPLIILFSFAVQFSGKLAKNS